MATIVTHDHGTSPYKCHKGHQVDRSMFLAEHRKITVPTAKVRALGDTLRPVAQALDVEDLGPVVPAIAARPKASSVLGHVATELLVTTVFSLGKPIDLLMVLLHPMPL